MWESTIDWKSTIWGLQSAGNELTWNPNCRRNVNTPHPTPPLFLSGSKRGLSRKWSVFRVASDIYEIYCKWRGVASDKFSESLSDERSVIRSVSSCVLFRMKWRCRKFNSYGFIIWYRFDIVCIWWLILFFWWDIPWLILGYCLKQWGDMAFDRKIMGITQCFTPFLSDISCISRVYEYDIMIYIFYYTLLPID